jgi:hypothetical protein
MTNTRVWGGLLLFFFGRRAGWGAGYHRWWRWTILCFSLGYESTQSVWMTLSLAAFDCGYFSLLSFCVYLFCVSGGVVAVLRL